MGTLLYWTVTGIKHWHCKMPAFSLCTCRPFRAMHWHLQSLSVKKKWQIHLNLVLPFKWNEGHHLPLLWFDYPGTEFIFLKKGTLKGPNSATLAPSQQLNWLKLLIINWLSYCCLFKTTDYYIVLNCLLKCFPFPRALTTILKNN